MSIFVHCPKCEAKVKIIILAQTLEDISDDFGPDFSARYSFGTCSNCEKSILIGQYRSISLYMADSEHFDGEEVYQLYPVDTKSPPSNLPDTAQASYDEIITCLKAKAKLATVVMVGRTLEAICKDIEPTTKTIFDGLRKMRDDGIISQEVWEWADTLRFLRNIGAHATEENISYQDAVDAVEFLQAIIDILYNLRPRFQELKSRRNTHHK